MSSISDLRLLRHYRRVIKLAVFLSAKGRNAHIARKDHHNRWQSHDREDPGTRPRLVPMRGQQRGGDRRRGRGADGVECPAKGTIQSQCEQQQERRHSDVDTGICATQDGIFSMVTHRTRHIRCLIKED